MQFTDMVIPRLKWKELSDTPPTPPGSETPMCSASDSHQFQTRTRRVAIRENSIDIRNWLKIVNTFVDIYTILKGNHGNHALCSSKVSHLREGKLSYLPHLFSMYISKNRPCTLQKVKYLFIWLWCDFKFSSVCSMTYTSLFLIKHFMRCYFRYN